MDKIIKLSPILYGGGQERGQRAGSENISGITGFGLAAKYALENLPKIKQNQLSDSFYKTPGFIDFFRLFKSNY